MGAPNLHRSMAVRIVGPTDPPASTAKVRGENLLLDKLSKGAIASKTSLTLAAGLSVEEWKKIGVALHRCETAIQWWLGDWWHYGAHTYGERAKVAAKGSLLGYTLGTLMNYGYVAGKVKPSLRNEVLSWWHHYQVASLPPAEQKKWLDKAVRFQWSARALAQKIYQVASYHDFSDEEQAKKFAFRYPQLINQSYFGSGVRLSDQLAKYLSAQEIEQLANEAKSVAQAWTRASQEFDRQAKAAEIRNRSKTEVKIDRIRWPEPVNAIDDEGKRYPAWKWKLPNGKIVAASKVPQKYKAYIARQRRMIDFAG